MILYALLTGSLPFDEDSTANLYAMIRAASYRIPNYLSDKSIDLIKRMLTANPLSRITIPEIINHPWFTFQLPLYINLIDNTVPAQANIKIDERVMGKTREIIQRLNNCTDTLEEIKKNIITREIFPHYNVIYEILYDMEENEVRAKLTDYIPKKKVFSRERVEEYKALCKPNESPIMPSDKWKFGIHVLLLDPALIMKMVFAILTEMKFEWKVDTKAYKVKCRSIDSAASIMNSIKKSEVKDKEEIMKSFYPELLKVEIKLYKSENKYVLDLNKINGRVMAFVDFCADFTKSIYVMADKIAKQM